MGWVGLASTDIDDDDVLCVHFLEESGLNHGKLRRGRAFCFAYLKERIRGLGPKPTSGRRKD